ncbi:PREDICTED: 26S protease regulatory subunit 4 [Colobus angolensis palliatus]|uniref:26S protease regulatory subunit 4 n=1 Tax=Colobus angolensis palliatus TaxID=336983 RepID=UPI0005F54DA8|nr:PREDICTED: 26S protease regulatory subunit 4 [Colobus angolensis palliatus]
MGQSQSGGHGPGGGKKDDKDKKKKYEPPVPTRVGKKKKKTKGPDAASKLPLVTPHTQCRLKLLKLERIKDYLLMEEEFIRNQEQMKPLEEKQEEERSKVDDLRGTPMSVGTLEEIIDDNHAIVSTSVGSEHYVSILSFVDKDLLEPGCSVLLNHKVHAVIGVLMDDTDPLVTVMKVEKAPQETYADIGGLDNQIQEIKESVELPLTHPEYYEEMGIKPPKGVILYGPPGTGMLCTSATFLRVVGSELIQKYLGDGPKLVRELFRVAEEHAPSIVFIDEIDAIGTKRYDSNSGGEREIQRTMLELLNQLDGFDSRGDSPHTPTAQQQAVGGPSCREASGQELRLQSQGVWTSLCVPRITPPELAFNKDVTGLRTRWEYHVHADFLLSLCLSSSAAPGHAAPPAPGGGIAGVNSGNFPHTACRPEHQALTAGLNTRVKSAHWPGENILMLKNQPFISERAWQGHHAASGGDSFTTQGPVLAAHRERMSKEAAIPQPSSV